MKRKSYLLDEVVDFIASQGGALFHVTDERNLCSICENGLLSKAEAQRRGITPEHSGGSALTRALDSKYGLDDAVFLGFNTTGIMPNHDDKRYRRFRAVCVAPNILYQPGVQIALGRANHANTEAFSAWRAVHDLDLDAIFYELDPTDNETPRRLRLAANYEILVPTRVPPEFILGFE